MKKDLLALLFVILLVAVVINGTHIQSVDEYYLTHIDDITPESETVTISIRCDTILDNTNNLNEEKAPFVPRNGTILPKTRVSFAEGDTVFEVLNKVCKAADIQIEYSWTPMYNSYYIEGINHLYEFDVGPESGWMYKVDEWFPNYGCSAYKLQDGQDIVWCYTCNGLGADVGEFWMG